MGFALSGTARYAPGYQGLQDGGHKTGRCAALVCFSKTTAGAGDVRPGQAFGTVHVHPSGKLVCLANQASSTADFEGKTVFAGRENGIAVFAIGQESGEPA